MQSKGVSTYFTDDYRRFKRLDGNRQDIDRRKKNILSSIQKVGYLPIPIIVNEKMEIVDGQARFEACKEINQPVCFMMVSGLGIEECRCINEKQGNWTLKDYVDSYAETGNISYIYMQKLLQQYGKSIGRTTIICIALDRYGTAKSGVSNYDAAKSGKLYIDEAGYNHSVKVCEYLKRFEMIGSVGDLYMKALRFAYECPLVDDEKLYEKFLRHKKDVVPVREVRQALQVIQEIYNSRARVNDRVYLVMEYEKEMAERKNRMRK